MSLYTYIDVNECEEGISGCQQLCNYNNGSYHCDCYSGYLLKEDRHMCEGTSVIVCNNLSVILWRFTSKLLSSEK